MALSERAQALAVTGFATMVRRDEPPKKEDQAKYAGGDLQDGHNVENKAINKLKTANMLPPVIWGDS